MTLPRDLSPMLAVTGALPGGGGWSYEVKWDGVRALVAVEAGRVRLHSRAGNEVTGGYPELGQVDAGPAELLLDGEVVAFDAQGRPDFGRLQERMHVRGPSPALMRATPVALVLFDVLHVDGESLLGAPYDARRERLEALPLAGPAWQVPPAFPGDGEVLLASTSAQGLEGVVAKRRDSPYLPGRRSDAWVKVKHVSRQSAVVVGWKAGEGGRSGQLGSLLLAVQGAPGLEFAGHVGTGFTAATLRRVGELLAPLATAVAPCEVPREHARVARWVRPELVVDVEFTGWTRDGRLRHPSYKGLRDDLLPELVVREDRAGGIPR